jgi:hypothetical protein
MRPGLGHATGIFPSASAGDLKGADASLEEFASSNRRREPVPPDVFAALTSVSACDDPLAPAAPDIQESARRARPSVDQGRVRSFTAPCASPRRSFAFVGAAFAIAAAPAGTSFAVPR